MTDDEIKCERVKQKNALIHDWATFLCRTCNVGFQIEAINTIGDMGSQITCPLCQSNDVRRIW